VLIATDVGGQGLNLQTRARWIINLELPWNPARLAQRIGRVDRIGQTRRVHATILVHARAERPVLAALTTRTQLARGAMGLDTLADAMPPIELQIDRPLVPSSPGPLAPSSPGPLVPSSVPSSLGPLVLAPPLVPSCVDWQRRARAMARALARRRRWMRGWRGSPLHGARPYVCPSRLGDGPRVLPAKRLAIVTVPIVSATGAVLERHVVALVISETNTIRVAALQQAAVDRAAVRLARIRGRVAAASAAFVAIERAIDAHLQTLRCPEETQLEFFSLRAARERDRADAAGAAVHRGRHRRVDDLHADASIAIGQPIVELIAGQWR
jgi:hypothetical protein